MPAPDAFYEQFLLAHNELRENHGSPPLQWSEELAELAQQWADKLAHKNFLTYCELPGIGENITFFPNTMTARQVVTYWYNEHEKYEYETPGWQAGTNYFTQIVWKATRQVGVGRTPTGKNDETVIVAFYKPTGNCNRPGAFAMNVFKPRKQ